jgi:hypothetical protein
LDSRINELFRQYCANPVFVIIDAQLQEVGLPTKAYVSVEEVLEVRKADAKLMPKIFFLLLLLFIFFHLYVSPCGLLLALMLTSLFSHSFLQEWTNCPPIPAHSFFD